MAARPMPVLPEVGSMMVAPGASLPSRSAASSIHRAALSLTLPVGFRYSSLHSSRAESPRACPKRAASSRGVPPTSPVMSFTICSIAVPPSLLAGMPGSVLPVGLTIKEGAAAVKGKVRRRGVGPPQNLVEETRENHRQKWNFPLPIQGIYGIMKQNIDRVRIEGAFLP